jgi:hypothetical protein
MTPDKTFPLLDYRTEATSCDILALNVRNSFKNAVASSIGVPLAPIQIHESEFF